VKIDIPSHAYKPSCKMEDSTNVGIRGLIYESFVKMNCKKYTWAPLCFPQPMTRWNMRCVGVKSKNWYAIFS
jgi:hypothetical protein